MFASLLRTPRPKHSRVALGKVREAKAAAHTGAASTQESVEREVTLDWERFQQDVAALATALLPVAERDQNRLAGAESLRWLLFTENPYAFAVALTALAQIGAVAVLPPNGQTETLQELADGCAGLLSDQTNRVPSLRTLDPLAQRRHAVRLITE